MVYACGFIVTQRKISIDNNKLKKKKKTYINFLLPQHPNRRMVFRDGEMELDTNFNGINRPFGLLENQWPHWFSTLRKQEFGMENEKE